MDGTGRDRLGELLVRAAELPAAERTRYLDEACGSDVALRREVESLLEAYRASADWFESLSERVLPLLAASSPETGDEGGPDDVAIGGRVSHYEILERTGRGGMGVVYRARDVRLGRHVALKFLPAQHTADAGMRARLVAEARATSTLDHPNIGVVHDIGETAAGGLFLAMTWYDGETLRERLARGPLPVTDAVALASQVARALAAAHEAGIVHRDVKPSNIVVTPQGTAKLLDFGIAKVRGSDLTRQGMTPGTVAYMSPEQTRGDDVDARSDLWSLGVVLYEMLAGRRPFGGDDDAVLIHAIRHDEPEPVERLRPETPPWLARVVAACLSKDPALRPAAAADLVSALSAPTSVASPSMPVNGASSSTPTSATSPSASTSATDAVVPRDVATSTRTRRAATALTAVLVLIIAGYAVLTRGAAPGPDPRRVLVAAFENRTGQPDLDAVGSMAADWVIQGLSQTGVVEVVPMTAALAATRYVQQSHGAGDPDESLRLLVAETGAGIVVQGAYYLQADSIFLRATLTDARRNRVLHALAPIAAASAQPLAGIEELRQRVMTALAQVFDRRAREHALAGASLPAYDAYRAYTQGLDAFIARDWRGAVERFAEAASLDSMFLNPLVLSALAFINLGDFAAVDSIIEEARPNVHRLDEVGRDALAMAGSLARGDFERAYRATLRGPELAPGTLAHWGLANAALWVNRPRQSVEVARQLDPKRGELRGWFFYWRDLTRAHHLLGEHRAELRAARRARAIFPDDMEALRLELRALAALRRDREIRSLLAEPLAGARPPPALWNATAMELLMHGAGTAGEALLRECLDHPDIARRDEPPAQLARARVHLLLNELDAAERILRPLAEAFPDAVDVQGLLGTLAARRGDAAEAGRIAMWLRSLDRPYMRGANTLWRARIASLLGNRDEAVRLLRQAFVEGATGVWDAMHGEPDLAPLRDHEPFLELRRPRG